MNAYVYDSGALIALDRPGGFALDRHAALLARRHHVLVPVPVAAQVIRAPHRQARLMLALRGCDIIPFGREHAAPVGAVLARSGTSDVVDGFVAVTAAENDAAVITSDPDDIARLLDSIGARLPVLRA